MEMILLSGRSWPIWLAAIAGFLVAAAAIEAACARRDRRRFPPPGEMTNGLHFRKIGAGGPVVIFEAGIAASCLNWHGIQNELAGEATTISYDRAGFGWSAAADGGASLERISLRLRELISVVAGGRPVILVGHSFGGLIARYFAQRFPGAVTALVLIDPATPEEWRTPSQAQRWRLRRAVFFTRAAGVLALFGLVRLGLWSLLRRGHGNPGPVFGLSETMRRVAVEVNKLNRFSGEGKESFNAVRLLRSRWSEPEFFWNMARYIAALPRCAREADQRKLPERLPVTVISAAGLPPERVVEHAAVAERHIVAGRSGHWVHLDEPELVVEAVRDAIARAGSLPPETISHE